MHRKLLSVLQLFSSAERAKLVRFVRSPYYNENQELTQLLTLVLSHAPSFEIDKTRTKTLFNDLYPGHPFDKRTLNRLNSRLFRLVEKFVTVEQLKKEPFKAQGLLLDYYIEKGLSTHVESKLRRLKADFTSLKKGNNRRADYLLMIEKKRAVWQAARDDRRGDINLQAYNEALDRFFINEKLELINAMLGRQRVINWQYEMTWLEDIRAHLSDHHHPDWPAIELYGQVLSLQLEPDQVSNYFQLKRSLTKHAIDFSPTEQRAYFSYLESAAKAIFSIDSYFEELFSLYKVQLDSGALLPAGKLHHTVFKNIVLTGLELGHFDWVENFIETYRDRVFPRAYRADAYLQNRANFHYYRQEYGTAQRLLLQSHPRDIYYKLSQKSMLARIYFETKELEVLSGYLNSFSKFIFDQKKKIAASKIDSYRLFVNSSRRLCSLLEEHPDSYSAFCQNRAVTHAEVRQGIIELQEQMEQGPIFYSKKWLLEQIQYTLEGR